MENLSEEPVAAASIGQVYKGWIEGIGDVAVKVKRPGIRALVERDAALLQSAALWVESLPGWKSDRLIAARVVDAVDEFMARIFEELDYNREVQNMQTFAELYSIRRGTSKLIKVVVPEVVPEWSTENLIVMEWIDGVKLDVLETDDAAQMKENLAVIEMGTITTDYPILQIYPPLALTFLLWPTKQAFHVHYHSCWRPESFTLTRIQVGLTTQNMALLPYWFPHC
jgi:predicted unusual protein kinase regulating ubiquinone biosynthesis (AarF/ABC1/UbiB family)